MLIVGLNGMTAARNRLHMSVWSIVGAPLPAGNNVATMTTETRSPPASPGRATPRSSSATSAAAQQRLNDCVPAGARATTIALRAGPRVDQLSRTLSNGITLAHGGTASSLTLGSGEYVTTAYLCHVQKDDHTQISYAEFTTNLGSTSADGTRTSDCVTRTAPSGWRIPGIHGRSGDEVDKVGFSYTQD